MSGTPVPYPSDVGSIAQRIFISDQDGVVWRLDVSSTNPANWFVEPFMDGFSPTVNSGTDNTAWALQRSPVAGGALNLTTGRDGDLVVNFGTGDTSSIGITQLQNFVYSVSERPTSGKLVASPNWYDPLSLGEMITGPATVFDGVYYFATYAPGTVTTGCPSGTAYLWGMDFVTGAGTNIDTPIAVGTISTIGGVAELLNPLGGANVQKNASTLGNPAGSAIIPGVAITSTGACLAPTTGTDPVTGTQTVNLGNVAPAQYSVTALAGVASAGASATTATTGSKVQQVQYNIANGVRTSTLVDSWASIVE
jgi:type IV pilus assembly protein PilY1